MALRTCPNTVLRLLAEFQPGFHLNALGHDPKGNLSPYAESLLKKMQYHQTAKNTLSQPTLPNHFQNFYLPSSVIFPLLHSPYVLPTPTLFCFPIVRSCSPSVLLLKTSVDFVLVGAELSLYWSLSPLLQSSQYNLFWLCSFLTRVYGSNWGRNQEGHHFPKNWIARSSLFPLL